MLLTANSAAGLRVKRFQDNVEIDIKGIALMIMQTENNFTNT